MIRRSPFPTRYTLLASSPQQNERVAEPRYRMGVWEGRVQGHDEVRGAAHIFHEGYLLRRHARIAGDDIGATRVDGEVRPSVSGWDLLNRDRSPLTLSIRTEGLDAPFVGALDLIMGVLPHPGDRS